ncbi:MAG: hypothetical protein HC902_10025 [Calothrix sp. SM1_5_4]|nr:hypothetical protein [Calothrix sp. SM1_5_4]
MKRYLLLKGRRRGHTQFMRGTSPLESTLNQNIIWILSVQENLLQRALKPLSEDVPHRRLHSLARAYARPDDDIRRGLAEEFAAGTTEQADFVEDLLKEIELVFNPSVPRKVRYFQAVTVESLLAGFIYSTFNKVLDQRGEVYGASWSGIWRQSVLHWRAGRFVSYIFEWGDFLRVAALQGDPRKLALARYEAMESLLRIFKYLRESEDLSRPLFSGELTTLGRKLNSEYAHLSTFKPWKEKRTRYSWIPLHNPAPSCRKMNEAHP